jgi:hypothetical protein
VKYLFTTSDDRVVHTKRQILVKNKNNMLARVEVFFSLNTYFKFDFPYMVFIKGISSISGSIIVDNQGNV